MQASENPTTARSQTGQTPLAALCHVDSCLHPALDADQPLHHRGQQRKGRSADRLLAQGCRTRLHVSSFWTLLRYSGWLLAGWVVDHRNALHLAAYHQEEQRRQARLYIPHIALLGPACLHAADRQVLLRQQREKPVPFCNLLAVPQFESAAPPYLAEPESISEADGQQDTDAAIWQAYAADDEAVAEDETDEEVDAPLADDAAVSDMPSGEEEQEQPLPAAQYLPAQLATMMADWPLAVWHTSVAVSWHGSEDAWLRFRQHASELGILLTSQPQRLHSPEDIDLVIDALHARQHSGYHLLAGIVTPAASFGASHGPPAAEAAFAMLASHTGRCQPVPTGAVPRTEHLALAQRNAALASPPTSFFSLNRDSPEELSAAGWQIDAVEHEPYWGIPVHWAAGSWRQWHWKPRCCGSKQLAGTASRKISTGQALRCRPKQAQQEPAHEICHPPGLPYYRPRRSRGRHG
jgi:hypothetical protein